MGWIRPLFRVGPRYDALRQRFGEGQKEQYREALRITGGPMGKVSSLPEHRSYAVQIPTQKPA